MTKTFRRVSLFAVAMAATCFSIALAQEPKKADEAKDDAKIEAGIEVQARGPVHEAFAVAWYANATASPVIRKEPPEPIKEEPPDQRPAGKDVQWIPGYWQFDDDRNDFIWVTGMWRAVPEGRRWVPGFWSQVDAGYQWVPGHWAGEPEEDMQYVPEPPASRETVPTTTAPAENTFYIPGAWLYGDSGYYWRQGYWSDMRDGHVWVPARYIWTPDGYVFASGYWDYAPEARGLMFAPAYFTQPLWQNSNWFFRPNYAMPFGGNLLTSLFVRGVLGQYFFGDFYGNQYLRAGYQPWYAYGSRTYDPLFGYYRWTNRNNANWLANIRSVNEARLAGRAALPPRIVNQTTIKTVQTVTPLGQITERTKIKVERVPQAQIKAQQQAAARIRTRSVELTTQTKTNASARVRGQPGTRPGAGQPRIDGRGQPRAGQPKAGQPKAGQPKGAQPKSPISPPKTGQPKGGQPKSPVSPPKQPGSTGGGKKK